MTTDIFNYFSRIAPHLSEHTELVNVLKSRRFIVSKPMLYVLYGSESKLIKVGKTKSSKTRLTSYLHSKGKTSSGSNFRKDDTIHLVGYYLLPNFDYNKSEYAQFISDCEQVLINNAKQVFGDTVYSNEWFVSKDEHYVMMSKLHNLFGNLNYLVDDSMYHILTSPLKLSQTKLDVHESTPKSDSVQQFADYCVDNELFGSHVVVDMYYLMYMDWCKRYNITNKPLILQNFRKRFSDVMVSQNDYTKTDTRYRMSSVNNLNCPFADIKKLFKNINYEQVGRSSVLVNQSLVLTVDDVNNFKENDLMCIDDYHDLTQSDRQLLQYLAETLYDSLAMSIVQ